MNTPYFRMQQKKLMQNLNKLHDLEEQTNLKILHTLKSFNQASVLPIIGSKLTGMSVTSPKELKMAKEAKAKAIHLYAPAFKEEELKAMAPHISTLSLNSLTQWEKFSSLAVSTGLRINPQLSLNIPSHCNPNLNASRLGLNYLEFLEKYRDNTHQFEELEGLHFHVLFQDLGQGLALLFEHIETNYQEVLPRLKWLNLGGGHDFTNVNYDVDLLLQLLKNFQINYPNIQLYVEPGESIVKASGEFLTSILDIVNIDNIMVAILDTSIETHLLDVAIVKQKLKVKGTERQATPYTYQLAGNSCLQGDIIGQYFFTKPLQIGDKLVFEDMMAYSMVKMTEFNGMEKAKFYLE